MPFKAKPVVKVGKGDWVVEVPRPPKHATHARMTCVDPFSHDRSPKVATLPIQDFACFRGVAGDFSYIRMNKSRKILEEYNGEWFWNGCVVEGIENLKD